MIPVYFYGTCMLDLLSPYTGYHLVRLLEEAGYQVFFPAGQTCCGQPAYNSGYREEARQVALTQLKLFSEIFPENYPILFPSGSCAAMMRHHYPDLFPAEKRVDPLSDRVEEWSRFYSRCRPRLEDKGERTRVVWHGSCHSLREMGVEEEPLSLLRQLSQVDVRELPHQRECCGFGGTFAVKYPDVSAAMGESKCQEIDTAGGEVLVSSDIGCLTHIRTRMEKMGIRMPCYHLADFLAERMGLAHPDFRAADTL